MSKPVRAFKYTKDVLQAAARDAVCMADVLRNLGVPNYYGSLHTHLKKKLAEFEVDTSHFRPAGQGWARGKPSSKKKSPAQILTKGTNGKRADTSQLRRAMLACDVLHQCAVCGQGAVWFGRPLLLQIDHLDGDWSNNVLDNLRFLCPNCHTQTENYGRKPNTRV